MYPVTVFYNASLAFLKMQVSVKVLQKTFFYVYTGGSLLGGGDNFAHKGSSDDTQRHFWLPPWGEGLQMASSG